MGMSYYSVTHPCRRSRRVRCTGLEEMWPVVPADICSHQKQARSLPETSVRQHRWTRASSFTVPLRCHDLWYTADLLPDRRPVAYFWIVRDPTAVTDSVTSGLVPDSGLPCSTAETVRLVPPDESLALKYQQIFYSYI